MDEPFVTLDELAGFLGVNSRNLKTLVSRGVIVRAKRGAYPLAESVRAYCGHLREIAAGRSHINVGSGLAAARERETCAKADIAEMKAAAQRRELLPAGEVEAMWSDILRLLRARFLALPGRVQQRLAHLSARDVSEIDREVRDVLTEISDDPI